MTKTMLSFVLTLTAVVMSFMLAQRIFTTEPSYAGNNARGGDYIAVTAGSLSTEDTLWIANINTQELIVCERGSGSKITMVDKVDLLTVFRR